MSKKSKKELEVALNFLRNKRAEYISAVKSGDGKFARDVIGVAAACIKGLSKENKKNIDAYMEENKKDSFVKELLASV